MDALVNSALSAVLSNTPDADVPLQVLAGHAHTQGTVVCTFFIFDSEIEIGLIGTFPNRKSPRSYNHSSQRHQTLFRGDHRERSGPDANT